MEGLKNRYRALPLFASPLEEEHSHHHHGHPSPAPLNHTESETFVSKSHTKTEAHEVHHESVAFREREEASSIELFYDLFFVANLSSFTNVKIIDDSKTIQAYIGFFALLWFNWLQVTLYDVRFGVDSIFERACKALHLGVMIAFAIVGTKFDPTDTATNVDTFRQFSIILLVSRLILILQYSYILFWVKEYRRVMLPIVIHIASFAVGAIICLGLTFSFNSETTSISYVGWYVVAALEALAVFISASQWRSVSFKHTNLNERCGLLTLIILGEGIIVLTKAMNNITKGEQYTAGMIGQIISTTLIIYFLYMLYFDQVDAKRFGTIRQQFWALAHFPFHISLVLLMEGCARLVSFRNAIEFVYFVENSFLYQYANGTLYGVNSSELASQVQYETNNYLSSIEADLSKFNTTDYIDTLAAMSDPDSYDAWSTLGDVVGVIINATLKFFKIEAPKSLLEQKKYSGDKKDPFSDMNDALAVYNLVFQYIFAAAGCTLIMMAILVAISKKGKCMGDYAVIATRAIVGLGLALVAVVSLNDAREQSFLYGPWMLPTILFAIIVVVTIDSVMGYVLPAPKPVEVHGHGHAHEHEHGV